MRASASFRRRWAAVPSRLGRVVSAIRWHDAGTDERIRRRLAELSAPMGDRADDLAQPATGSRLGGPAAR